METQAKIEKSSVIHHVEWLILMLTLIGGVYVIDGKVERQGTRVDKLYEMYCEMQKEIKDVYIHLQKNG